MSIYPGLPFQRETDSDFLDTIKSQYGRYVRVGRHTGQVRLSGPAYDALRTFVWQREAGKCKECGAQVILEKGFWQTMHLAHYRSKGSGGSDLPGNTRALCGQCHAHEHSGKKIA